MTHITSAQRREWRALRWEKLMSEDATVIPDNEPIPYMTREMAEARRRYPLVSDAVALEQHRRNPRKGGAA